MKKLLFHGSIVVMILAFQGCIWWDDEWLYEQIEFVNHTEYRIECYVEDDYECSVPPFDETRVKDRSWDGRCLIYCKSTDGYIEWGPEIFYIDDGDSITIDLYDDHWTNCAKGKETLKP